MADSIGPAASDVAAHREAVASPIHGLSFTLKSLRSAGVALNAQPLELQRIGCGGEARWRGSQTHLAEAALSATATVSRPPGVDAFLLDITL